jgi:hypothetical protein
LIGALQLLCILNRREFDGLKVGLRAPSHGAPCPPHIRP